jgi:uncharacterized protein YkwD
MDRLKYGPIAAKLAKQQKDYLIATGRMEHLDENGEAFAVRALAAGLFKAGEIISGVYTQGTYNLDVDQAYAGWKESPHHYGEIINPIYNCIGWADGFYPETTTSLILGAGQYNPATGTYTTEESTVDIPEAMWGKLRLFVVVFSNEQ